MSTAIWFVEFTDYDGGKHSEPANCGTACGVCCEFSNTEQGAHEFAEAASQWRDAAPPRAYLAEVE